MQAIDLTEVPDVPQDFCTWAVGILILAIIGLWALIWGQRKDNRKMQDHNNEMQNHVNKASEMTINLLAKALEGKKKRRKG